MVVLCFNEVYEINAMLLLQITNHGVEEKVLHKMKAAVTDFFELPLEEKKKYAMAANDLQGYGQAYVVSEQQKLNWCDMIFLITLGLSFFEEIFL